MSFRGREVASWRGVRVLVTGGAGFVGAALSRALVQAGATVRCVDPSEGARLQGVAVTHLRGSVLDAALMQAEVSRADLVLHLAAVVGVDRYLAEPAEVLRVNIDGTRTVVDACVAAGVPLLFSSTSEVYGKNPETLREDSDTVVGATGVPRWSYALSKAVAEHWCHARRKDGLRCSIVRYFNVYGPGLDTPGEGRVLSKFVGQLRAGRPLTLVDGGEARRTFCYIDDAVRDTLAVAAALLAAPAGGGETFNIGSGEQVSIRNLAELLVSLTGHPAGCVDVPAASAFAAGFEDIPSRKPDLTRLHTLTGDPPSTSLREGLRRTLRALGIPVLVDAGEARPVQLPWVPYVRSTQPHAAALGRTLAAILASGSVTNNGPYVQQLEAEVAQWTGAAHAVAVSSGSSALTVAALALGLRGKIALPAFTFQASWAAFGILGLQPVFCDVDPATWTLDPADLDRRLAVAGEVQAVVAVNVFGVAPDLAGLASVCARHGVPLLYDSCHGLGTEIGGHKLASEPLLTIHSLHATKVIGAVEGGLLLTHDAQIAARARDLRNHGLAAAPLDATPGPNAKLDELRACVALDGLRQLPERLERRRRHATRLRLAAAQPSPRAPRLQFCPPHIASNAQNLGLFLGDFGSEGVARAEQHFADRRIATRRYFSPALHRLHAVQPQLPLPISEALAAHLLCLPLANEMSELELTRVEQALRTLPEVL